MPEPRRGAERYLPLRILALVEQVVASALVVAVLVLVVFQVVTRYVFDRPFVWSEELARFALIWLTFVAAAYVMSRGAHITVVVGSKLLGRRAGVVLQGLAGIIVVTVCVVLAVQSPDFLRGAARTSSPAADIPMSWVYGAAGVGFVLMGVHSLATLFLAVRDPEALPGDDDVIERM